MRILKWLGIAVVGVIGTVVIGVGIARLVIDGPIFMLAGGELAGEPAEAPADWGFTDDHQTIAVEVRPADPHSVTTVCFAAGEELYIPAMNASEKQWTQMAIDDGTARLGIGEKIYPVQLVRVEAEGEEWGSALAAARAKYPQLADGELPPDVWLFRAQRR